MPIRQRFDIEGVEAVRVGRLNTGINTTFVLYRIGTTLIDTGPSNQWRAVRRFVDEKPPKQLVITHHHEDHSANGSRLAKRYGVKPWAPRLTQDKLKRGYKTPPVQRWVWGSPIPVDTEPFPDRIALEDGSGLVPVHTPGHAKDHHCLFWPEHRRIFTGDLFLARSLTYMRIDENLQQLMSSIIQVLKLDFETILCSHRGIVENGPDALREKLSYLKQLCIDARQLQEQGIPEPQAVERLLGPEDMFSKLSFYNISKRNLYREAARVKLDELPD